MVAGRARRRVARVHQGGNDRLSRQGRSRSTRLQDCFSRRNGQKGWRTPTQTFRGERHRALPHPKGELSKMENRYKVADIKLAEWGRKEIGIAEKEMPGLMALR